MQCKTVQWRVGRTCWPSNLLFADYTNGRFSPTELLVQSRLLTDECLCLLLAYFRLCSTTSRHWMRCLTTTVAPLKGRFSSFWTVSTSWMTLKAVPNYSRAGCPVVCQLTWRCSWRCVTAGISNNCALNLKASSPMASTRFSIRLNFKTWGCPLRDKCFFSSWPTQRSILHFCLCKIVNYSC